MRKRSRYLIRLYCRSMNMSFVVNALTYNALVAGAEMLDVHPGRQRFAAEPEKSTSLYGFSLRLAQVMQGSDGPFPEAVTVASGQLAPTD